jgi:type IX secretion system PorP/SprF family membrane protein
LNTALSLSYIKSLGKNFLHALSGGVQVGIVNRNINYSKLNFDNQWNGDRFDPNIAVDENFAATRFNYFDLGVGIAYKWTKAERTNFTLGFGVAHLTQPKQTLYNDNTVKLNPRYTAHTRAQVKVAERFDLVPEMQFQMQDSKYEASYGAHTKYYPHVKTTHTIALNLGVYGRSAEAGWLLAGMDYDNLQVNLSYDINFSKLRTASRYNGGIEVSVIYIISRVKKIYKPGAVCPVYL